MTGVPVRTALVAEDDATLREILRRSLEHQGFRVVAEGDGRSALDACLAEKPDLIITDILMPGLHGTELVARARAAGVDSPALIVSTSMTVEAHDLARREKRIALLQKPFPLETFVATISALLTL
jgi:DNA-binding response OmpR family regulator